MAVAVAVGRLSLGDTSASRARRAIDGRPAAERMYYRLYNASVLVLYLSVLKQLEAETPAGQVAQFCDGY